MNFKKIIAISLLGTFLWTAAHAQEKLASKSFISLYGGPAWLSGNVTKDVYSDKTAGFAKNPGTRFGADGAYFLSRYFGLGASFSFSQYGMNSDQLAQGTDYAYDTDFGTTKVGIYTSWSLLVGPYLSYPVSKWLTIDYFLLGGLTHTVSPQLDFTLEDAGNFFYFYQNKSTAYALGAQTGLNLRANIYKGFGLVLKGDYFYSKPNFNITYSDIQNEGISLRQISNYHQPFSGFALSLGVVYSFK